MSEIIDAIDSVVAYINNNILWAFPMIFVIIGTGIYFTIRTRGLQVRRFGEALKTTIVPTVKNIFRGKKKDSGQDEKNISQFEAFSTAISGTVGTGNIVGVTGALLAGGPGAVFWMWVSAFFGLITNYSENLLGLYFRKRDKSGSFNGGPMYYIENGIGWKPLAFIFALCCSLAALGMGMVQINSISGTIQSTASALNDDCNKKVIAWIVGITIAVMTALIIIGGIQRIGKVASMVAPFMALLFIVMAVIILCVNITSVPKAFALIFENAFSFRSVEGGFLGYVIMKGMRYGFARGVFSNEAGLGSTVIAHTESEIKEPVKQGMWSIFEVFLDTFVICTLTAVSLISTGLFDFTDIAGNAALDKADVASSAFSNTFGNFGLIIFTVILPLFAFTTIIAWSYYGQNATEYIFKNHPTAAGNTFKVIYVLLIVAGAVTKSTFVWDLDEFFNACMAIPNLIALIILGSLVVKITKNYFERKNGADIEPMLSAYPELNAEFAAEISKQNGKN